MGMVTQTGLETMFNALQKDLLKKVELLAKELKGDNDEGSNNNQQGQSILSGNVDRCYFYNDKHYIVPKGYHLPDETKLFDAFDLFVRGNTGLCSVNTEGKIILTPIFPLVMWKPSNLPKEGKLWVRYNSGWRRILTKMAGADFLSEGVQDLKSFIQEKKGSGISVETVQKYYNISMKHVLSEVEYIKAMRGHMDWPITTWSKRLLPSEIKANGTPADIAWLPAPTRLNQKHRGEKRKMTQSNQRAAKLRRITTSTDTK